MHGDQRNMAALQPEVRARDRPEGGIAAAVPSDAGRLATGLAYVLDSRQPYLRAKRRMISPNIGSFTFSAACEAESHFTTRSCFSGHCLFWRRT